MADALRETRVSAAPDAYLTIEDACRYAQVSRRTIYNWKRAGKLVTRRTVGGALRILASSLWQPTAPAE